jgi:hypothetical protein
MQLMLSSISGKPLTVFCARIRDVSASFDALKLVGPNTSNISLKNFYMASHGRGLRHAGVVVCCVYMSSICTEAHSSSAIFFHN